MSTTTPFRLGFLAFVEHGNVGQGPRGPFSRGLKDGLELFELADELGFDTGWVRHRHLQNYLSSPLPFLTAAGARTTNIHLGTAVIPLRFENAARLAEDAATVDLLTNGRLELGLSSGYAGQDSIYSDVYGTIDGDLQSVVDTELKKFFRAVEGDTVAVADAEFLIAPEGTPLTVLPHSPTLRDRVYYGSGSKESAIRTGSRGLRLQLSTLQTESGGGLSFEQSQRDAIRGYRQAHAQATDRPSYAAVSRQVLPVTRDRDRDDYGWLISRDQERQAAQASSGAVALGNLRAQFGKVPAGSPEEIVRFLGADVALAESDELIIALPFDHPIEVVKHILTVVATEIAPALGWRAGAARVERTPAGSREAATS
jgi:alkanesulfonate monooxygenase SsuD/methylene tetrahydromethanopterin reductase-like flavin-dependent oxidoreductase (luciferase family)